MKQMIKFEVKRMLRNPGFYIAMMIGLLISVVHWIVWVLPAARGMDKYMSLDFALLYPPNLYNSWICEGNNMYSYLYLLILPILVTLPYAATFFSDVNNHLIEFIGRNCILCSAYFQYSALYGSCADNKTTGGSFNVE